MHIYPDSKVHGANMGPIWGRQDPGGPHVGPMNLVIWVHQWTVIIGLDDGLAPVCCKPLSVLVLVYCQLDSKEHIFIEIVFKI